MSKKTCKDTDTKLMSLINSYHTLKIFKIMTVKILAPTDHVC